MVLGRRAAIGALLGIRRSRLPARAAMLLGGVEARLARLPGINTQIDCTSGPYTYGGSTFVQLKTFHTVSHHDTFVTALSELRGKRHRG
eukprot:1918314-Rhodomonas_salina.1